MLAEEEWGEEKQVNILYCHFYFFKNMVWRSKETNIFLLTYVPCALSYCMALYAIY